MWHTTCDLILSANGQQACVSQWAWRDKGSDQRKHCYCPKEGHSASNSAYISPSILSLPLSTSIFPLFFSPHSLPLSPCLSLSLVWAAKADLTTLLWYQRYNGAHTLGGWLCLPRLGLNFHLLSLSHSACCVRMGNYNLQQWTEC